MFYTYVLYSDHTDKIYIGYSADIHQRLDNHNSESNKGWTRSYRPWRLIYYEEFEIKALALKRERQLKSAKGRAFIRNEILNND